MFGWNFLKLKCKVASIFGGGGWQNQRKIFPKKGD